MKARTPHALKAGDWRSAREGGDAQRLLGMRSVVLLHAAHAPVGAVQSGERADHGADAGERRHARHTSGDRSCADRRVVDALLLAVGRVQDQVDLAVLDRVDDVRMAA